MTLFYLNCPCVSFVRGQRSRFKISAGKLISHTVWQERQPPLKQAAVHQMTAVLPVPAVAKK
jgi:hypothetical protein